MYPARRNWNGAAQTCNLSVSVRIVACRANFPERGCVRSTSRSTPVIPRATLCGWVFDHSRAPFWLRLGRAAPYRGFVIFVIRNELPGTTPCRLRRSCNPTLPLLHRMEERAGERRWPPLSSVLSPLLRRGARKKNPRMSEFARTAPISTDTHKKAVCASSVPVSPR